MDFFSIQFDSIENHNFSLWILILAAICLISISMHLKLANARRFRLLILLIIYQLESFSSFLIMIGLVFEAKPQQKRRELSL
jgi:hypothetical protein